MAGHDGHDAEIAGRAMTHDTTPAIVRINPPELGTPPGYSQIVEVTAGRIIFIASQTDLLQFARVDGA
jgi:hypothetical protein